MARIRTIKPEFFTSEDIVTLSPLARLLYIALWCEADKEGRMVWKPATFKLRYLPGDNCDIHALSKEIADRGLVVLYGNGYAHIPAFKSHQHINPRETASQLPEPDAKATRQPRVGTRQPRVKDACPTHREEGKGREGKEDARVDDAVCAPLSASPSADPQKPKAGAGTRLPEDWTLPDDWRQWAQSARPDLDAEITGESFHDFWVSKPGKDGRKSDWQATWRNWVRGQKTTPPNFAGRSSSAMFAGAI